MEVRGNKEQLFDIKCPITVENLIQILQKSLKVKVGTMIFMNSDDFAPFITNSNEAMFFDKHKQEV